MSDQYKDSLSPEVLAALDELKKWRTRHLEMGQTVIGVGLPLVTADLLIIPTLNRSMSLLKGFCTMIEQQNFIAAAPLVRLELDCCLRLSAMHLSSNLDAFTLSVMGGTAVRDLRDRDNQKMTDGYLVRRLARDFPWVVDVYKETSGYIHLSEKHIFNALKASEEHRGHISMKVSDVDSLIPDDLYIEAINAFDGCIDILAKYVMGYAATKQKKFGSPDSSVEDVEKQAE